ncbi:nitrile hydratase subunit beta [Halovulum dunhuangense]|uniref:Nitrile hydratase subunit beta n=1 Tax=Halovulum dunhuangense TaxID=1505036 RepID=A0A849L2P5_9RHOB|nr:nitrile hydratase subunit beta [Halovulum dunhuangense]NNU80510.1 nitrile hydratase subunit beta [Halovulum dunhuangense]
MNGPQDLGGRDGFGPVSPETREPLFHADWEKRALALTLAAGALGHWTLDESRHARESLPPLTYYGSSYYEIWIRALEILLQRHGEVGADELAAGHMLRAGLRPERRLQAAQVAPVMARGGPVDRPVRTPARFAPGDTVRTRNHQPRGHTRLPGYAREKTGVIEAVRGVHVYPDSHAHGRGEDPHWLYTVAFDGRTLWGDAAAPGLTVSIDAWEPYLEPA